MKGGDLACRNIQGSVEDMDGRFLYKSGGCVAQQHMTRIWQ